MKFNIYIFTLIVTLLVSCKKEITFDLNEGENEKLVVEGFITTEKKAHQVILSRSHDYYHNEASDAVSNAVVFISHGTISHSLTENIIGSGIYETDTSFYGIEGSTYTLDIMESGNSY